MARIVLGWVIFGGNTFSWGYLEETTKQKTPAPFGAEAVLLNFESPIENTNRFVTDLELSVSP
jgi:hypothetical protein